MNAEFLRSIYEDIYGPLDTTKDKIKNLDRLARRLSRLIGHKPFWTGRYLNGILLGHKGFGVTRELATAMQSLADRLDDTNPLQARLTEVHAVYSLNGNVQAGDIILGSRKSCEGCSTWFVPRVPWQIYCCPECPKRPPKRKAKAAAIGE